MITCHYHKTQSFHVKLKILKNFPIGKKFFITAFYRSCLNTLTNFNKLIVMGIFRYYRFVDPPQPKLNRSNQSTGCKEYHKTTAIPRNPIITVTEHTPTPSPDFMRRQVILRILIPSTTFDFIQTQINPGFN